MIETQALDHGDHTKIFLKNTQQFFINSLRISQMYTIYFYLISHHTLQLPLGFSNKSLSKVYVVNFVIIFMVH